MKQTPANQQPFSESYSQFYDLVYGEKDYDGECRLIESILRRYHGSSEKRDLSVLDIGCGTGEHLLGLVERGFIGFGVDRSPSMLQRASEKFAERNLGAEFQLAASTEFSFPQKFDACISMFAVFCYHTSNDELTAALEQVSRHLEQGGIFIMDFWYGPAVLALRPETRVRIYEDGESVLYRMAVPQMDWARNTVSTEYHLLQLREQEVLSKSQEVHTVRYFFLPELEEFLSRAGLQIKEVGAFPEFDRAPDNETWNVMLVAQKL